MRLFGLIWCNLITCNGTLHKKEKMMVNSLTLIPKSIDSEKLEDLLSKQIASMKRANGLRALKMSEGPLMSPGGPPSYSKVVETTWESLEDFMAWVQNQTSANHADKDFMIESGAILLFYEVKEL